LLDWTAGAAVPHIGPFSFQPGIEGRRYSLTYFYPYAKFFILRRVEKVS
jgi:hypothetical protein